MQAPRGQGDVGRPPRVSVLGGEPRWRRSASGREHAPRLPAHPLEFDERGVPLAQPPLSAGERLRRLLTG